MNKFDKSNFFVQFTWRIHIYTVQYLLWQAGFQPLLPLSTQLSYWELSHVYLVHFHNIYRNEKSIPAIFYNPFVLRGVVGHRFFRDFMFRFFLQRYLVFVSTIGCLTKNIYFILFIFSIFTVNPPHICTDPFLIPMFERGAKRIDKLDS